MTRLSQRTPHTDTRTKLNGAPLARSCGSPSSWSRHLSGWAARPWRASGGIFGSGVNYKAAYSNNQLIQNPNNNVTIQYDASGNLTNDGEQQFTYDANGSQVNASINALQQGYDGGRVALREDRDRRHYVLSQSSVLGGKVVSEIA